MQGIYSITNKVNGKRYIGLSIDIEKRLKYQKLRALILQGILVKVMEEQNLQSQKS